MPAHRSGVPVILRFLSRPARGWPRAAGRSLMLASVLSVAACESDRSPVAAVPTPAGRVIVLPDDTTWNTFTTEVGVMVNGDYPNWGVVDPTAARSFGFTLTRTALSGGNWANVVAFDPTVPSNQVADPNDYDSALGRIEHDDRRTYMRLYTRLGALIPVAGADTTVPPMDPSIVPPARDTGSYPRHPSGPGIPMPMPRLSSGRDAGTVGRGASVQPEDPRAWLDYYVVGNLGRQRIRKALAQSGAMLATTSDGSEQFTTSIGSDVYSVALDRLTGAPTLLTRVQAGVPVMREVREYAPFGSSAVVLRRSRVEYFEPGHSRAVRQFAVDYVNTTLRRADR